MADSSTTSPPILDLMAGSCWAQRQLRGGITDLSVASKPRQSLTLVRVVFIDHLGIPELDGGSLHNRCSVPASDCGSLLGLAPAAQWYKVCPCRIKAHEIAVFCARCIRYQAGDMLLDGRYLHNRSTDFDSVCGRLLDLMLALQQYKIRLYRIRTQEIPVFCEVDLYSSSGDILLDGRLLHSQLTDFDALCGRLLRLTPASQRYKVGLCRIRAHESAVFCGGCIRSQAGDTLHDGRLLLNRFTDHDALCGRLLGLMQASQRYKVRLCRIETQEIAVVGGERIRYRAGGRPVTLRQITPRPQDGFQCSLRVVVGHGTGLSMI